MKTKNTIQIVETPDIDSHDFYANNGVINPAFLSTGDTDNDPQPPEPPHRQQHQHRQHQDYYQYQHNPNPQPKQHSLHRQQHPSTPAVTTTTGAADTNTDYRQTYFRPTQVTNPYGNGSSIASSWVYEFNNGSSVGTNSNTSSPSTGTTYTGEYIGMMSGPTTTGATLPSIHRPSFGRYDPHLAYDMDLTRDHKLNGGGGATGADGLSHGSNGQCCRTMLRLFVWALILVSLLGILISVAFIIYVEKFAPHQPSTGAVQCCNSSISSAGVTGAGGGRDRFDRNITEPSVVSTMKKVVDNKVTTVPPLSTSRLVPTPATNATVKATLSPVEPRFSIQTHMTTTGAPEVNDTDMTTTGLLSLNTTTGANTTGEPLLPTTNGTDISTGGDVSDGTGSTATTVTTTTTTTAAPVVNITAPDVSSGPKSGEMVVDSTEHEFIITSTGTTTTTTTTPSPAITTTTTSAPMATGTTIIKPIETTSSIAPVDTSQPTTATTSTTPVPTTTTTTTTTPSPAIGVKETTAVDYTNDYYERADSMGANETTTEHNYAADNGAQQDLFNAFT
ncbi:unnamed protein product [Medioppia subpectinata]|uniref:Uncharacterized protein n=1 Tax=Medioppia subpectinata TaxID=1979941 RepID=A0A7R9L1H3_9ACAR|nr:unnamed protein product [Medioppia subpectinata]CAG2112591.1 unnamed protein product [Medioppia subpectinata]